MEQYIEETKLALKWLEANDIQAYIDTDKTSIYIQVNEEDLLISGSEVSYRASLYEENNK